MGTQRRGRQVKTAECVFHKGFITTEVDPLVDRMWRNGLGVVKVPFGDLRNMFRRHHCRTLNPYGDSELCPYTERQCAMAFLEAVNRTVNAHPRVPVGYFIKVAKSTAAIRADEAVDRRAAAARLRRTDVHPEPAAVAYPTSSSTPSPAGSGGLGAATSAGVRTGSTSDRRGHPQGSEDQQPDPLPGRSDGPVSLGDLLGRMAPRPREGRGEDGAEGGGR